MKPSDPRVQKNGVALIAALLVLTALTLVGHATWLVAASELTVAFHERSRLEVRLSAESMALNPPPGAFDSLPARAWTLVARHTSMRGIRTELSVWPLGSEDVLVVSEGQAPARRARWRVGRLYWRLDPIKRLRGFSTPLEAVLGTVVSVSSVVSMTPDTDPPGWDARCDALPAPDTTASAKPPPAAALDEFGTTYPLQLGHLDRADLLSRAARLPDAIGTPQPSVVGGLCAVGDWNWGSPGVPSGPCGSRFVLKSLDGNLTLDRGAGQGTLVVTGDLTMRGTSYVGVILVGGTLRLEDGAEVRGYVRSGGATEFTGSSRYSQSSCGALLALSHSSLLAPLPNPLGSWIRPVPEAIYP